MKKYIISVFFVFQIIGASNLHARGTKLNQAVKEGNRSKVLGLLAAGYIARAFGERATDINNYFVYNDDKGGWISNYTPLMTAVLNNNIDMIKFLLRLGADVNTVNNCNMSALMVACHDSVSDEIVQILLDAGAKVNCACYYTHNDGIFFPYRRTYSSDTLFSYYTPLMFAVSSGNINKVNYLLQAGATVNDRIKYTFRSEYDGETALNIAVDKNSYAIVEKLLESGANIDQLTIERAIRNNNNEIVQILCNSNQDIIRRNPSLLALKKSLEEAWDPLLK